MASLTQLRVCLVHLLGAEAGVRVHEGAARVRIRRTVVFVVVVLEYCAAGLRYLR